jgi:hypothetical protein
MDTDVQIGDIVNDLLSVGRVKILCPNRRIQGIK